VRALAASDCADAACERADAAASAADAEAAAASSSRTASAFTLRRIAAFFRSSASFEIGPPPGTELGIAKAVETEVEVEAAGSNLSELRTGR
jgi:hypothetical protein